MAYNYWGQQGLNHPNHADPSVHIPQQNYFSPTAQGNPQSTYPAMGSYDPTTYGWGSAAAAWGNNYTAQKPHDSGGYPAHDKGVSSEQTTYAAPAYGYAQPSPYESHAPRGGANYGGPSRGFPASRRGRGSGPMNSMPRPMQVSPSTNRFHVPQDYEQFLATQGMRGGARGRGGFPMRARGSPTMGPMSGAQRPPRPQPRSVPPPQQLFCEICKITCAGQQTFQDHLKGKQHRKKEQNQGEAQILAKNKSTYRCDVCDCSCTGKDTYEIHMKGARHQKTIALLQRMGKPIPEGPTIIAPPSKAVESLVRSTAPEVEAAQAEAQKENGNESNGAATMQTEDEIDVVHEPIGREFIEKQTDPVSGKVVSYSCKLCVCSFTDPNAQDHHLKGRRHRLQYKMKVDPQLELDDKTVQNKRTPKRFNKTRQPNTPQEYKYVEPMTFLPVTKPKRSRNDFYVCDRDAQLVVTREYLDHINRVVTTVEKTMQAISNHMYQMTNPAEALAPTAGANNRVLQGVLRIRDLVKGLLGKDDEDKTVDIVVLTNKIPSFTIVRDVAERFPKLVEAAEGDVFTVEEEPEAGRLFVKEVNSGSVVRVWFTCYLVRETLLAEERGETVSVEKPADPLPTENCLEALAHLRRAKWYQERCLPLPACIAVIRVMRYIRQKNPIWQVLPNYTIELLVEKAIRTAGFPVSPGDAFRRFFEMIASGFLISGQPGLCDPCEMNKTDILIQFPMDKRLEITSSAQYILRVIAMDQLYRLLDVPKRDLVEAEPPTNDLKRTHQEEDNQEENGDESKKAKLGADESQKDAEVINESPSDAQGPQEVKAEVKVEAQPETTSDAPMDATETPNTEAAPKTEIMDTVEASATVIPSEAIVKTEGDGAAASSEV